MKRDGVLNPSTLLKHRFLVRLDFRRAGGGAALHSEVVVRFRSLPQRVFAKGWTPGGPQRGRAQLGAWQSCKNRKGGVGRTCPTKYNGRGFVDVTRAFSDRNILFVHDPAKRGRGRSVIWVAANRSQQFLWYYVVPHRGWPSFGKPRVSVQKFLAPEKAPVSLPGNPPDPGSPRITPRPTPRPAPRITPRPPPRTHPIRLPPARITWTTESSLHRAMTRRQLRRLMKQDGIPHPGYLLKHRFHVRLALEDAGHGSASRSELVVRLLSRPEKVLGKAWADRRDMHRAQIGATNRCQALPAGRGGPEGHRCPMHFNGLGWRNLKGAFTAKAIRIVTNPNNSGRGNVVLWLAFNQSQSGFSHRFVKRSAMPTFGEGKLTFGLYALGGAGLRPIPAPGGLSPGWKRLGSTSHSPTSRAVLTRRLRRDGVASPAYLLKFKYLVRLSVSGAGAGYSRRSEVIVRMNRRPQAALGVAWSDHRQRWGAQLGAPNRCRAMPQPNNPYGHHYRWRRASARHTCPVHYNGLGWRNLISAFAGKRIMLITVPHRSGRGNQLLWLGFNQPQPGLSYRAAKGTSIRGAGRVVAEKFQVGRGAPPDSTVPPTTRPFAEAPGRGAWQSLRGSHTRVHKNSLYWTIRRDGFNNPWYLLRKRYVVRLELTASGPSTRTLIRFGNRPGMAVGKGTASGGGRSAVQAGTQAACLAGRCPLHYGNLGWRNLITGLSQRTFFFGLTPSRGRSATTALWLSFDNPQSVVRLKRLAGHARVSVKRYSW